MSKLRASDNDGEENVCYELFCVVYVNAYDEVALPNYLVHLQNQNDFKMEMDVKEELNERGNGGDLDDDGDYTTDLENTMRKVKSKRSHVFKGDDRIYQAGEGEMNSVLLHVEDTM